MTDRVVRVGGSCPHLEGYDPLAVEELRDPYPSLARARREAPVFFSEFSHTQGAGVWCITRHEDVERALAQPEVFSNHGAHPLTLPPVEVRQRMPAYPWSRTILQLDGPEHKAARAIIQAPFTPRNVRMRKEFVDREAERLVEKLAGAGEMEFVRDFAYPLSLATVADILGVPKERFEDLRRWISASFSLLGGSATNSDEVLAAATTVADLTDFLRDLVEDRRAHPRDDYVSVMVHTPHEDGSLESTENLQHHIFTLVNAGFETTALTMALGLRGVLRNRGQWEMLLADRSLVPSAVEEMLRHRSLLKRLFRTTKCDVEVAGVMIPEGSLVALLVASAHRDDARYTDPDRFDITRTANTHFAFGKGKHFCVGAPLARIEITAMLTTLLERLPDMRLADPLGEDEEWRADVRFDALRELPVVWSTRH